jgi:SPP1 gp7 family putative phage head morphogenesis protein
MTIPAALFRNAIDLNRYSNSVGRQVITTYNDIIIDAVNQLRTIDELAAPVKAARLRAILAQLKDSLNTWSGDSITALSTELQGLAELQSDFVTEQLRKALPAGARTAVNTVEISPQFAQSVVTTDPTQLNVVALSDDLYKSVYGVEALANQAGTGTFNLTAAKGATITLPNGEVVSKAFRGIAVDQAEQFGQVVRNGLLTGETTSDIAKRLIGILQFGEEPSMINRALKKIIAAGGQSTSIADNQIMALVRTSINQVANAASMAVYESNQDITKKYQYVAALDTRTSAICRALDGQEFEYGKGPMPPQHFNCRSKVVAVIDYENLGFTPPPEGTRASKDGQVDANINYSQWLKNQPRSVQEEVLGKDKVVYFNKLAEKHGARDAMAKLVRDDGSELSLKDLRERYSAIKER